MSINRLYLCLPSFLLSFGVTVHAQSPDALTQVYSSSATATHYKRRLAKLLGTPAPSLAPAAAASSSPILNAPPAILPSHTATTVQIACKSASAACPSMIFHGLKAGSSVTIYASSGAPEKTLSADAGGGATWDETDQSGLPVPSGNYYAQIPGAGAKSKWAEIRLSR